MKTLKIGVLSREKYKARTLAIARGEYVPAKDEAKIWFESVRSMGQVLSEENQALLKLILETEPQSMVELAKRSGRAASNLSRTLRTMERYGLVHFEQGANRQLAPRVDYSGVAFEMSF
jgi:predicted transcriptional regulator